MAFIADSKNFRTFDPERGLELVSDGGGSDGDRFYRITRPDGAYIHFSTRWEPGRWDEWCQQNPTAFRPTLHYISATRGRFPDTTQAEADAIIHEAMMAYKFVHGLPEGSHTEVFFPPAN